MINPKSFLKNQLLTKKYFKKIKKSYKIQDKSTLKMVQLVHLINSICKSFMLKSNKEKKDCMDKVIKVNPMK